MNTVLDEKQQQMFLRSDMAYCPFCGTQDEDQIKDYDFDRVTCTLEMGCNECGSEWNIVYGQPKEVYDV